jgi:hypothetical protein
VQWVTRSQVQSALRLGSDSVASNPYTTPEVADISAPPEYAAPQTREFASPDLSEGDAYIDEFGWAPKPYRASTVEVPSAQRLGTFPRVDYRPDPVRPAEEWYDKNAADENLRHSVESQDADGWTELKGVLPTDMRWADNPRRNPPAETRPTMSMAPSSYLFTRPFAKDVARFFNGMHFSMADHRRDYDILGMAPPRARRNTYRVEPQPWDIDIVDMPPTNFDAYPDARIRSVEVPSVASRSWRL